MASSKRRSPEEAMVEQRETKKAKVSESDASLSSPRVLLNPADCDLDFNVDSTGLVGYGLHEQGFAYCWSGARATVGITKGRYCFGCKVVSAQTVEMEDTVPEQQHVCRVGISRGDDMVGNLGDSKHSFGYGGTGKFSNAAKFSNFGDKFGVGDTIVCCIDLDSKPLASIGFSKNGKWLGTATQFDAGPLGLGVMDSPLPDLQWKSALFPHVLLKNVVVQMQFSVEDGSVPVEGFKPWASAVKDGNMVIGPTLSDPRDCEVMMMVGLPASGKSTWAEKLVKDHPEKRYVLLGTNLILDQMKVPGLLRKNNYGERFERLMDRATGIFNVLLSRAANIPHNYIIDQTNVYKNARKRKLKPFLDYQKIAVVVFPKPEEHKIRSHKRFQEMGKEVPSDAVNEMIANFVLPKSKDMPCSDEFFDRVMFVELNQGESEKYLNQMKQDLASKSNHNSSTLACRGSFQPFSRSPMPNHGRLAGTCNHWRGSYPPSSLPNYGMPNQLNANDCVTQVPGSFNSFSGVYPSSQIPHVARASSPGGPYSNNELRGLPRDNAGYDPTYGVIAPGGTYNSSKSVMGGPYRQNIVGEDVAFRGAFPDPYRSGMNEPTPIACTRTISLVYGNHGRPYGENRGFETGLHSPFPTTYDSLSPYGTPTPRPPYPGLPDNSMYSGRNASWPPRYC